MTTNLPETVHPIYTGMALAYKNTDYIADEILPRVSVTSRTFEYKEYDKGAFLTQHKTEVGRTGEAETMEYGSKLVPASCVDHSIKGEVPQVDIEEAQAHAEMDDPMQVKAIAVTDNLKLMREVRVAKLVTTEANYKGNVITLDKTKDETFTSKKSSFLDVWKDVLSKMWVSPTHAVVSRENALYLQTHPDFVGAYIGGDANRKGFVPLDFVAQSIGLKKILIGTSRVNTAKYGKTPNIENIWGDDMIFFYQNPLATVKDGLTFGLTAEKGKLQVYSYNSANFGAHGVNYVRPVETLKELIVAPDCGCLIKNAFAK